MSEEKLKVLEMLRDNQITPEEALQLLQQLPSQDKKEPNTNGGWQDNINLNLHKPDPVPWDPSWLEDLKDNILESAKNITEFVANPDFSIFDSSKPGIAYAQSYEISAQEIRGIKIEGKNARVDILGHDDTSISLTVEYKPKANRDPRVSFEEENGSYTLYYDGNSVYSMGVRLHIPKVLIRDLNIENKNAGISLADVQFEDAELSTKNAPITIENITGRKLKAETRNAPINLSRGDLSEIIAKSSNAKITLANVNADTAKLQTSNSSIKTDTVDIRNVLAKTTNSSIKYHMSRQVLTSPHPQYSLEATTANGNISVDTPFKNDIPCKLKASTSTGKVKTNIKGLELYAIDKNFIDAKSSTYDNANKRLNLALETSNGSIHIETNR